MTQPLDILAQVALMACVALGAWTAMAEGMVLNFVARIANRMPPWLAMPLATCPRCMCSIWGVAALIVCGYGVGIDLNLFHRVALDHNSDLVSLPLIAVDWPRLAQVPVLIIAACGVQEMLHRA